MRKIHNYAELCGVDHVKATVYPFHAFDALQYLRQIHPYRLGHGGGAQCVIHVEPPRQRKTHFADIVFKVDDIAQSFGAHAKIDTEYVGGVVRAVAKRGQRV